MYKSPPVRESMKVLDSGTRSLDSRFQLSGFRNPYHSGFRIPNHYGFRIPTVKICWISDSGFSYMGRHKSTAHEVMLRTEGSPFVAFLNSKIRSLNMIFSITWHMDWQDCITYVRLIGCIHLYKIGVSYIAVTCHYITSYYIALHCIALHYIILNWHWYYTAVHMITHT